MSLSERIIYFHGVPGSPDELRLFGRDIAASAGGFCIPDRWAEHGTSRNGVSFRALAETLRRQFPSVPLRLVGFSLGASAALRTAPHLGDQVRHIDLVSAAAPLGLGNYLPNMAGAPVFRLAKASPLLFGLLSKAQSVAARVAPERLYAILFASAHGKDKELVRNPIFRATMLDILKSSLVDGLPAYRNEIAIYVDEWAGELDAVTQPVNLWHGRADNWSPVAMAEDLARRLPQCVGLTLLDQLSHYSTLGKFLADRAAR